MNTIKQFLEGYEASTIKDIATNGVQSGIISELIYNVDILEFFKKYESSIEETITTFVSDVYGLTTFDALADIEVMETLSNDVVNFTDYDEMLDIMHEEAVKIAIEDFPNEWEDMVEDEQESIILDYLEDVEPLPTDQDKINFVWLAVELAAQELTEEEN